MSESESEVVEIQEIAAEDMKIILKYIYGMLDSLPEGRLHHLILAADRLQALNPTSLHLTGTTLWSGAGRMLLCMGTHQYAHRKNDMCALQSILTYVFADDAADGAMRFPFATSPEYGHLCGDSTVCRQSESSGPARGLCGVCTAGEGPVCSLYLPSSMCLTLQLSTSL